LNILPPSSQALDQALTILQKGGIVAHATETCYGFACDLTNPEAVQRLFAIKKRPSEQPVSALFPSIEEAKKYVEWNDRAEELAKKHLPGPLTLILPLRSDAPMPIFPSLLSTSNFPLSTSLGIRVSSHPLAQSLVERFGKPLSTTSANPHGQPNPYSAEEISKQFRGENLQPDLILDSGPLSPTPPSTVIDMTPGSERKTMRQGVISNE